MGGSLSTPKQGGSGGSVPYDRVSTIETRTWSDSAMATTASLDYCNCSRNINYSKVGNYKSSFMASISSWKKLRSSSSTSSSTTSSSSSSSKKKEKNIWMRLAGQLSGRMDQHQHHHLQQQQQQKKRGDLVNNNNDENRYSNVYVAPCTVGGVAHTRPTILKNLSGVYPLVQHPVSTIAYTENVLKELKNANAKNKNNVLDYQITKSGVSVIYKPNETEFTSSNAVSVARQRAPVQQPLPPVHCNIVIPNRKTVQVQASSAELLACIGVFLEVKCLRLRHFRGPEVVFWIRSVDRALLANGWQDIPFVNPANLVFLFMMLSDSVDSTIVTVEELQSTVFTCLYLSFTYMGNEISYPLKPFLLPLVAATEGRVIAAASEGEERKRFWSRCLKIIAEMSAKMLRINRDPVYFSQLFKKLKTYSDVDSSAKTNATPNDNIVTNNDNDDNDNNDKNDKNDDNNDNNNQ